MPDKNKTAIVIPLSKKEWEHIVGHLNTPLKHRNDPMNNPLCNTIRDAIQEVLSKA